MPAIVVKPTVKSATVLHSVKPVQKSQDKVLKSGKAKAKPTDATVKRPKTRKTNGALSDTERRNYIEVAAYYIAQRRGSCGGCELEDWLQAEQEVARLLK